MHRKKEVGKLPSQGLDLSTSMSPSQVDEKHKIKSALEKKINFKNKENKIREVRKCDTSIGFNKNQEKANETLIQDFSNCEFPSTPCTSTHSKHISAHTMSTDKRNSIIYCYIKELVHT